LEIFAQSQSDLVLISNGHGSQLDRRFCGGTLEKVGLRGKIIASMLGPQRACEKLASEISELAAASGHRGEIPFFFDSEGQDEVTKDSFRQFQIARAREARLTKSTEEPAAEVGTYSGNSE
jgi:hypothetical protein